MQLSKDRIDERVSNFFELCAKNSERANGVSEILLTFRLDYCEINEEQKATTAVPVIFRNAGKGVWWASTPSALF